MNIAHLICPMKLYGKEKWLLALLKHIDRTRYPSIVIPLIDEDSFPLADMLNQYGIEFHTIRISGKYSFRKAKEIADLVEKKRIDILHTHDYKSDILGLVTKSKLSVKVISTPHGWSNEMDVKLQLYQMLDRLALGLFDHVAPLSLHIEKSLVFTRNRQRTLIVNFIDIVGISVVEVKDEKLFSYVGRLTPLKRVVDVIHAITHTNDKEIRLQIIGDGPQSDDLKRLVSKLGVQDRVLFLGFRNDALDLLGRSAALVLPSLTEGTSRIVMEAMAMGKPVIGTDVQGINTLIEQNKTGLLVSVKDPRSIARAMDRLATDKTLSHSLGSAARDHILENHSAEVVVKKYEKLYDRVCASSR